MLYGQKFNDQDLDFLEKEIRSSIEFFENRKLRTDGDKVGDND